MVPLLICVTFWFSESNQPSNVWPTLVTSCGSIVNTLYVYDGTAWKDALSQGVINYNNLTNIPIINAGSSTVSTPGIYRTTAASTTFSGIYKNVEHQGALVIYDGTHAIEIYGTDIKYHGPTASSEVMDIISTINSLGNNKVTKNPAITGATKTKITFVTATADALAASSSPSSAPSPVPPPRIRWLFRPRQFQNLNYQVMWMML